MNYDIENVDILVDSATFYLENSTESTITDMYHNVRAIRLELEKFPLTESFPDDSISERIDYLIEKLKET